MGISLERFYESSDSLLGIYPENIAACELLRGKISHILDEINPIQRKMEEDYRSLTARVMELINKKCEVEKKEFLLKKPIKAKKFDKPIVSVAKAILDHPELADLSWNELIKLIEQVKDGKR